MLTYVRKSSIDSKTVSYITTMIKSQVRNDEELPKGNVAKFCDSIINWMAVWKLYGKGHTVKIKWFPRSTVDDMSHHLVPVMQKNPGYLIIHVGTNDALSTTSRKLLNNLLNLKSVVKTCC